MAHDFRQGVSPRMARLVIGASVVALLIVGVIVVMTSHKSPSSTPQLIAVTLPAIPSAVAEPSVTPIATPVATTAPSPVLSAPVMPSIPDLESDAQKGEIRLVFPSIGFDEPLVPIEIPRNSAGQPVLPQDVRAYLRTNFTPKNCDVSGGDIIMGHTSIYTDYWGKVPFNAFKSLESGSSGQPFTIGVHQYEVVQVIVQPKAALTTTKEFWCQPAGNVSILSCYTQEEGGDNIIVIGRPVS